jgi:hypothetical protein
MTYSDKVAEKPFLQPALGIDERQQWVGFPRFVMANISFG